MADSCIWRACTGLAEGTGSSDLGHKKGGFACEICFPSRESEAWRLAWGWEPLPGPPGLPPTAGGGIRDDALATRVRLSKRKKNCRRE